MNRCRTHTLLTFIALGCAAHARAADLAALNPAVEKILDAQEAKGKDLKDIKCKLQYIKEDKVLNEKQTLKGGLLFKQEEPNPRFMIQFDQEEQEGVVTNQKQWFLFDGLYFIEARQSTGNTIKHEMLKPGQKKDIFKLGEGPFPVPFGQKKKDIVDTFTIKLIPRDEKKDPPGTDHLECTPKPGTDIFKRYGVVHFWIDQKLNLPVKLSTHDKEEDRSITAIFTDVEPNKGIPGSDLNLPKQTRDYKVTVDPLPPANEQKAKERSK